MLALAACLAVFPGCYSKRFKAIDANYASLSAKADSLANEHARTRAELAELKKQVGEHENTMRSLRAGTQTGREELMSRLEQLEARLEDQSPPLNDLSGRARTRSTVLDSVPPIPVPPAPSSSGTKAPPSSGTSGVKVDPTAAYDQAVLDFTQGRFPLALTEFRAFVSQHGATDLGDNAQYGVGESFYAIGQYDSAAIAYRDVIEKYPQGDKVPAALYKLGIAYQKANKSAEARTTYNTLIEKYPSSGEAKHARERLKEMDQR
jgi:tol-pal system protein YbgF